ncbi:hypothetical protein C0J52_16132 [Blattella germanica]|nr:hypothetical protein C0J52_16132 [Blattella germanica]
MVSGLIVTTVLLSTVNLCLCQEDTVTVKIDQGELRGKVDNTINGFKYYSFQGIPYAKPPVGSLRFKSPQPADPWDGVRDALEVGSICPQYISGAAGDEDCLFVNVVTTLLPDNETTELKPVMVSIHGGGFTMGFGSLTWNGPYFFVEEDVIFVSMNYRLGALGLFHKAIAQSGSALNYWGYEEPDIARTKTEKFCEFLGNASTDSNEMAEFLRSLSIEEILLGTDFIILAGVDRHVSLHAEVSKAPVYQYLFSFNGRWGMVKSSRGDSFPAVGHGDDMDYFYYNSGLQYDFNSMEYTTLKRIVKMWTNFAKTGNPTPVSDPLLQNVTWSPVTALDNFYLEIGNDLIVKRNLENDRMSFWKDIYTRVIGS